MKSIPYNDNSNLSRDRSRLKSGPARIKVPSGDAKYILVIALLALVAAWSLNKQFNLVYHIRSTVIISINELIEVSYSTLDYLSLDKVHFKKSKVSENQIEATSLLGEKKEIEIENPTPKEWPKEYKSVYAIGGYTKQDFLSDKYNRISNEFSVSENLYDRVGFWFDVYTIYDSGTYVIHDTRYPWIIYKVIDVSPILNGEGNKWTKYHKANRLVHAERRKIIRTLKILSRKRSYRNLSPSQYSIYKSLKPIKGKRRWVFANAARRVRMQLGQKDFIEKGIIDSSKYIPVMEGIFRKYDLPVELTRLPFVESSFNYEAVSKVGASGIWQFMPNVGKMFMAVGKNVDERNSPLKATEAAAHLLKENKILLKKWPLAVTAYNHGPAGVKRAVRAARSNDLGTIIKRYSSKNFAFASKNFYTEFIAALHAEKYHKEIYGNVPKQPVLGFDEIKLPKRLRIKSILSATGLSVRDLLDYNLDLNSSRIGPRSLLHKGYNLHLPLGFGEKLEDYFIKNNLIANSGSSKTL